MSPAPSTVIDGVPPQFDELVRRATARDPADRYADAREMGAAVDAIADELACRRSGCRRRATPRSTRRRYCTPAGSSTADHRQAASPAPRAHPAPSGPHAAHPGTDPQPEDWQPATRPATTNTAVTTTHFAGIELDEFDMGAAALPKR